MAPLSTNPDRNFSAGYGEAEPDLDQWMAEPSATLDDLFNDPVIRERVGKLIGKAMGREPNPYRQGPVNDEAAN